MNALRRLGRKFRRTPPGSRTNRSRLQSAGLDAFAETLTPLYLALTAAFALLGHAYAFAFPVLAVVFLGHAAVQAARLEWFFLVQNTLLGVACVALSFFATRVRPALPDLPRVPERNAPKLFQLIEDVRAAVGAPPLVDVFLDEGLDVRLVRTPRSGYPLRFSYSLIVGLPALQLLSPPHFRGLLVRRLGAAAGRRYQLLRWLSLWRDVGPTLLSTCPDWRGVENVLVRVFYSWYAPLYSRWSIPAARLYELRIDQYMMESINDEDVAELFSAQLLAERYLNERYFPELLKLARKRPHPLPEAYSGLDRKFSQFWQPADAERWLEETFARVPRADDLRPALAQRLAEIGHTAPRLPAPVRQPASRALLGGYLKQAMTRRDGLWMRRVLPRWRALHQAAKREQQRLQVLFEKSRKQTLDLPAARELATLVERCYGKEKAIPFYRQLLINNPRDANVSFAAGRFLLSVGDSRGVRALRHAMRLDPRFAEPAATLLESFAAARRSETTRTGTER